MTLKKIFLNTAILLTLCNSAFALPSNETKKSSDIVYSETQLNITIDKKNPTFRIRLKSNPTTGYSWFLREYDHELIMPVKSEFEPAKTDLVGGPGSQLWVFKVKPGAFTVPSQSVIRLIYARPWQGAEGSNQLVFRVSVIV